MLQAAPFPPTSPSMPAHHPRGPQDRSDADSDSPFASDASADVGKRRRCASDTQPPVPAQRPPPSSRAASSPMTPMSTSVAHMPPPLLAIPSSVLSGSPACGPRAAQPLVLVPSLLPNATDPDMAGPPTAPPRHHEPPAPAEWLVRAQALVAATAAEVMAAGGGEQARSILGSTLGPDGRLRLPASPLGFGLRSGGAGGYGGGRAPAATLAVQAQKLAQAQPAAPAELPWQVRGPAGPRAGTEAPAVSRPQRTRNVPFLVLPTSPWHPCPFRAIRLLPCVHPSAHPSLPMKEARPNSSPHPRRRRRRSSQQQSAAASAGLSPPISYHQYPLPPPPPGTAALAGLPGDFTALSARGASARGPLLWSRYHLVP
jgi:hypothetical protein